MAQWWGEEIITAMKIIYDMHHKNMSNSHKKEEMHKGNTVEQYLQDQLGKTL